MIENKFGGVNQSPGQILDGVLSFRALSGKSLRRMDARRRGEPGVCAAPASNLAGPTMWIAAEEFMASRIKFELVTVKVSGG